MLIWLRRPPEAFVRDLVAGVTPAELPRVGPDRILRWDVAALCEAIDVRRRLLGVTWREAAERIGLYEGQLVTLRRVGLIGCPELMRIVQWVGQPAVAFTFASDR